MYKEYLQKLEKLKLKSYKINLSKIDDIEEKISQGYLSDFVEEYLDDASVLITKARDTVKFDMTDAYTEAEGMLNELEADIKALGIDAPAEVKTLRKNLNHLDKEIDKWESKVRSFG
jgi:predicted RNase H-like nuclease (RuvC/YqgF family)